MKYNPENPIHNYILSQTELKWAYEKTYNEARKEAKGLGPVEFVKPHHTIKFMTGNEHFPEMEAFINYEDGQVVLTPELTPKMMDGWSEAKVAAYGELMVRIIAPRVYEEIRSNGEDVAEFFNFKSILYLSAAHECDPDSARAMESFFSGLKSGMSMSKGRDSKPHIEAHNLAEEDCDCPACVARKRDSQN